MNPLHVGLNLVFLVPGETGGMEVARARADPGACWPSASDLRFTAFVNREARGGDLGAAPPRSSCPSTPATACSGCSASSCCCRGLARARRRRRWCTRSARPRRCAGAFRRVTTIHDLNYKLVPEAHFGVRGAGHARARAGRRAPLAPDPRRRGVDADDLVAHLRRRPRQGRRRAARGRAPSPVRARRREDACARARPRRRADRPAAPSAPSARTRTSRALIEALAGMRAPRPMLVLPGYPTPYEAELREPAPARRWPRTLRFPAGSSTSRPRGSLRAGAAVFAFPSLYEGFGLPVLEAMARGVPVACSNRSSLPEVAGDAALLVDPEDRRAIAAALERCCTIPPRPTACARRARARRRASRGQRTAELTRAGLPARARSSRSSRRARPRARAAARWPRTTRGRRARAAPSPPSWTRTIASARSSGAAEAATKPLTPVLDQLRRGVVGLARPRSPACPPPTASTTTRP